VKSKVIQHIVTEPLMCCMHYYVTNKSVFSECLKLSLLTTSSLKLSISEFHTDGLAAEKEPHVLSW